ncbi:MAG TPA: S8 family peptidase [Pseudonocardiaceae bacterium]|nr:S8 family peptidase [Pseudonocardiaceae bacterium]
MTALVAVPTADAAARATHHPSGPVGTVTLVTGDHVTYRRTGNGIQVLGSTPAAQRVSTTFATMTEHGDQYVIPMDAWPAVAGGQLDKRLFDITSLVAQGLDDAHDANVKVIVTGPRGYAPNVTVPKSARVTHTVPGLGMRALSTAKKQATALWTSLTNERHGRVRIAKGTKIWLDGTVHATLDQSVPLIGAPTAWQHGHTGKGVTVAVLDTGIDAQHPDLVGKVVASQNFSDSPDADDHDGHGTHVASIITGSGAASGGRYRGVAPGVRLISGKVLDDTGGGDESGILAGMEWAVQQGAKVINMSLGTNGASDGTDVLSQEVNTLSASSGALFVIAAGNAGGSETVSSPGSADAALTVASTTKQDTLSTFSSRGPRIGNFGLKPDIAAPGQDIVAARAPGAFPADAVDAYYVKLSGTSMATPHVSGSAAIVAGEHPDWTGQQIKAALMDSAQVLPGIDVFGDGAGRVDVARATTQAVHALTPDVSLGDLAWPAEPTTADVTYANDSDTPVTLTMSMRANGLFSTATPTLTVPAHGTATETVDVAAGPDDAGSYDGRLVATAPGVRLVTPVAAQVQNRTDTVSVHVIGRDGKQASSDFMLAALQSDTTGDVYPLAPADDGSVTAQVPDGTYRLVGGVADPSETFSPDVFSEFALDGERVDGATTLTVDVRQAKPSTVTVDEQAARPDQLSNYRTIVSVVDGDGFGIQSNSPTQYVLDPAAVSGVTYSYAGAWGRPQDVITMSGLEIDTALDQSDGGWQGDVTGPLVDIGEQTDPTRIGDVTGAVILIAPDVTTFPSTDPPTQDQMSPLLTALKAKGAKAVLSYDYVADLSILPTLQLFDPNDIQSLRDRLAAGVTQVHVLGQAYTPYVYALENAVTGALPDGQAWHFAKADLAEVDTTYRSAIPGAHFDDQFFLYADPDGQAGAFDKTFVLPQTRTEYYSPGIQWSQFTDVNMVPDGSVYAAEQTAFRTFQAGRHTTSAWASAPFAPRLPAIPNTSLDGKPLPWVYRQGDKLYTAIPMFNEADAEHMVSPDSDIDGNLADAGTTVLYHGRSKVDGSDEPGTAGFTLPAATGTYRLVVDGTRPTALSPHVHAEWTFRSSHTDPAVRTASALLDLGFTLPLDGSDSAAAGAPLTGTVTVTGQGGAALRADRVSVDVSYDDGRTWHRASVTASRGQWRVTIPAGGTAGGYATLRASAGGPGGNAVTETITRAYGLR